MTSCLRNKNSGDYSWRNYANFPEVVSQIYGGNRRGLIPRECKSSRHVISILRKRSTVKDNELTIYRGQDSPFYDKCEDERLRQTFRRK